MKRTKYNSENNKTKSKNSIENAMTKAKKEQAINKKYSMD